MGISRHVLDRLARIGLATKGAVYALIGGLAIAAAVGAGGKVTGGEGAIKTIGQQPFGKLLLVLIAIGLFGYALWRFVQAALNTEREPHDGKGYLKRIGYGVSGVIHGSLGMLAVQMIGGRSGGSGNKTWLVSLLGSDFGRVLVAIGGVAVIAFGLSQLSNAYTAKFRRKLATRGLPPKRERMVVRLGRLGLAARGVIFPIIGFFLLKAAAGSGGVQKVGLDGALQTLAAQPMGTLLLVVVALGLLAYGAYMFASARYRRSTV